MHLNYNTKTRVLKDSIKHDSQEINTYYEPSNDAKLSRECRGIGGASALTAFHLLTIMIKTPVCNVECMLSDNKTKMYFR